MMKTLKIGVLGAPINNKNLGCQALTYSLINMLNMIAEENSISVKFIVFEYLSETSKVKEFCENLNVKIENIEHCHMTAFGELKCYVKHFNRNIYVLTRIKKCDFIIDLTEGDSFTDIYGKKRFNSLTRQKDIIEKMGVPLILGPQTYGPFFDKKNQKYAAKIIGAAQNVIARDNISASLVKNIAEREVSVTTDLAFQLPYIKPEKHTDEKKKIGLNISGLLVSYQIEKNDKAFDLAADYDEYIDKILTFLEQEKNISVYLIPHVEEDVKAIEIFHNKYPYTIPVSMFDNPIQAKSYIAQMDVFIGARMHATIAAFTSGVFTIPVAYSRKFEGLFNLVDYPYIIDLQKCETEEIIKKTIGYIKNSEKCLNISNQSLENAMKYVKKTKTLFTNILLNYC